MAKSQRNRTREVKGTGSKRTEQDKQLGLGKKARDCRDSGPGMEVNYPPAFHNPEPSVFISPLEKSPPGGESLIRKPERLAVKPL
jgi:hypothetical protein